MKTGHHRQPGMFTSCFPDCGHIVNLYHFSQGNVHNVVLSLWQLKKTFGVIRFFCLWPTKLHKDNFEKDTNCVPTVTSENIWAHSFLYPLYCRCLSKIMKEQKLIYRSIQTLPVFLSKSPQALHTCTWAVYHILPGRSSQAQI